MTELGQTFIHVASELGPTLGGPDRGTVGGGALRRVALIDVLRELIARLTARPGGGGIGGTLYFASGVYELLPSSLDTGPSVLRVPPEVVLRFAPGALLVLVGHEGSFPSTTAVGEFFGPGGSHPEPLRGAVRTLSVPPVLELHGRVEAGPWQLFATGASERVRRGDPSLDPDRYGEVRFTGPVRQALLPEWWGAGAVPAHPAVDTAALQACFDASTRRTGFGSSSDPLPVHWLGSYLIERPIQVGGTAGLGAPVATGVLRVSGRHSKGGVPSLRAAPSFSGEALLALQEGLAVRMTRLGIDGAGVAQRCVWVRSRGGVVASGEFAQCTFIGATRTLLEVAPRGAEPGDDLAVFGGTVELSSCTFAFGATVSLEAGVRFAVGRHAVLRMNSCVFDGGMEAMVLAERGQLRLVGDLFQHGRPGAGTDLLLRTAPGRSAPGLVGVGLRSENSQLLRTEGPRAEGPGTLLVGVDYRRRPPGSALGTGPSPIAWTGSLGAPIHLLGCTLEDPGVATLALGPGVTDVVLIGTAAPRATGTVGGVEPRVRRLGGRTG